MCSGTPRYLPESAAYSRTSCRHRRYRWLQFKSNFGDIDTVTRTSQNDHDHSTVRAILKTTTFFHIIWRPLHFAGQYESAAVQHRTSPRLETASTQFRPSGRWSWMPQRSGARPLGPRCRAHDPELVPNGARGLEQISRGCILKHICLWRHVRFASGKMCRRKFAQHHMEVLTRMQTTTRVTEGTETISRTICVHADCCTIDNILSKSCIRWRSISSSTNI